MKSVIAMFFLEPVMPPRFIFSSIPEKVKIRYRLSFRSIPYCIAVACCVLMAGCFSDSKTGIGAKAAPYEGAPLKIVMIPVSRTPDLGDAAYWNAVYDGAVQASKDLGKIEVVWQAPAGNQLIESQTELVHDAIHDEVDGILLAPIDARASADIVDAAIESGIPVVIFGSELELGPEIVSQVATDHVNAGLLAADAMADSIDEKGGIILLRYLFQDTVTRQRNQGILEGLAEYSKIKVLSSDQRGGIDSNSAKAKMEELFAIFGDRVSGVIVSSQANARGVLEAIADFESKDESRSGTIKLVTFDPNGSLIDAVENGKCTAAVLQDPYEIGYRSVVTMVNHLSDKKVKPQIATGEYVLNKKNFDHKKSQRLRGATQ